MGSLFPDPCGAALAEAVAAGGDPRSVVPDEFYVVRGGSTPMPPLGTVFSAAVGPTLEAAAAAVPHGQIRFTLVRFIRSEGGHLEWTPQQSRYGTWNQQHVDAFQLRTDWFSDLQPNPVPRQDRIDGDKSV